MVSKNVTKVWRAMMTSLMVTARFYCLDHVIASFMCVTMFLRRGVSVSSRCPLGRGSLIFHEFPPQEFMRKTLRSLWPLREIFFFCRRRRVTYTLDIQNMYVIITWNIAKYPLFVYYLTSDFWILLSSHSSCKIGVSPCKNNKVGKFIPNQINHPKNKIKFMLPTIMCHNK